MRLPKKVVSFLFMKDGHEYHYLKDPDIDAEMLSKYGFEEIMYRKSGYLAVKIYKNDKFGLIENNEGFEIVIQEDDNWIATNTIIQTRHNLISAIAIFK